MNSKFLTTKKGRQDFFVASENINDVLDGMVKLYESDFSRVNPWVITVGQLDKDEAVELFVGAYRPTYFYEDNTRPYFIEYKNGLFVRQWTGSYLDNLCFHSAEFKDDNQDGISTLFLDETVLEKGELKEKKGEFTIQGFQPIRLN